jgi:hypothetical protein
MLFAANADDPRSAAMLKAVRDRGGKSLFLKFLESLGGRPSRDTILAAISITIAWGPLMRKRISRLAAETLPWYLRLYDDQRIHSARASPSRQPTWHFA